MAQAETIQSTFNGAGNGAAIGGQTGGGYGALIGGIVGAAGGLASGIMGSNAEEEAYKRRKKAYESMLKRATEVQTEGEGAFNNLVANPNSYLGVMQRQLNDNTNKDLNMGRNQLNLALAQQGLRGGQAATQLNRGPMFKQECRQQQMLVTNVWVLLMLSYMKNLKMLFNLNRCS